MVAEGGGPPWLGLVVVRDSQTGAEVEVGSCR